MIKLKDLLESGEKFLNEMPVSYSGDVVYWRDSKFTKISLNKFKSYKVMWSDVTDTYVLKGEESFGFVFLNSDIENYPKSGVAPVMSIGLRDTEIKGYKQAYRLRIRKDFARMNVATTWYCKYVDVRGGIVSDGQHLMGGKLLWKSFIDAADKGYSIYLYNRNTGESISIDSNTPESEIWSSYEKKEPSKEHLVLVMEKR
jgi:hypothetical protein